MTTFWSRFGENRRVFDPLPRVPVSACHKHTAARAPPNTKSDGPPHFSFAPEQRYCASDAAVLAVRPDEAAGDALQYCARLPHPALLPRLPSRSHPNPTPPPPSQELLNTTRYQLRAYGLPAGQSFSTARVQAGSWGAATNKGFGANFAYIEGANANKKKIPMTAPVITRNPGGDEANWLVSFFTPQSIYVRSARARVPRARASVSQPSLRATPFPPPPLFSPRARPRPCPRGPA